jgi:hypothetical protein
LSDPVYRLTPKRIIEVSDKLAASERLVVYGGTAYARGEHRVCRPLMTDLEQDRCLSELLRPMGYELNESALGTVFRSFMARTKPAGERIRAIALGDDPGDCLVRLSLPKEGDWSAWNEFTSRLDAPETFCAWVWSVFELRHGGRQMCWLRGDGHEGKSRVTVVLASVLGTAAGVLDDDRLSGDGKRFALASVWDKRLISVPDTKVRNLAMTGLLHQLSGGDVMFVEAKGQQGFSARPDARVLIASNEHPAITRSRSNTSRLIPIEVAPRAAHRSDPTWEPRLIAQVPAFLAECRRAYEKRCPNHGDIELEAATEAALEEAASELEDLPLHVAETIGLVKDEKGNVPLADLHAAVMDHFPAIAGNDNRWGDFKRWLRGEPFKARRGLTGEKRNVKVLRGIRLRPCPHPPGDGRDHYPETATDNEQALSLPYLDDENRGETTTRGTPDPEIGAPCSTVTPFPVVSVVSVERSKEEPSGNGAIGGGLTAVSPAVSVDSACVTCRTRSPTPGSVWCSECFGALLARMR